MTHGNRQHPAKVHCKVPYRTYERRAPPIWKRRIQESEDVSNDEDDDDDEDDESDGSPPILTKAHVMLAAKKKVIVSVCWSSLLHHLKSAISQVGLTHRLSGALLQEEVELNVYH